LNFSAKEQDKNYRDISDALRFRYKSVLFVKATATDDLTAYEKALQAALSVIQAKYPDGIYATNPFFVSDFADCDKNTVFLQP
jgi:hypothetical protein